jgi:L-malate glycosyltransferase
MVAPTIRTEHPAVPFGQRLRRWVYRRTLRSALLAYDLTYHVARLLGRRPRPRRAGEACEILLTGTFHSDNWINSHLRPLAASALCARLYVVTTYPLPPTPNVVLIPPPRWLRRVFGSVGARLLTFVVVAHWKRPHYVGGFHLLLNGLTAALVARLAGSRAAYFCVGGPAEVLGGGIWSENRLFSRLEVPDPVVERRLIRAVRAFDLVVTMGTRAVTFFREHGVSTRFEVVSGGIDPERFAAQTGDVQPAYDLILVGRLVEIKRVDIFLHALRRVADRIPTVRAVIVGDGPLRPALERLSNELGLADRVTFAGQRQDVGALLRQSRVFVLTSDSEGLSLSLMEAMTCGLPAVVTDVGDLADLVQQGVNGYLVPPRASAMIADAIVELLADPALLNRYSAAARAAARRHKLTNVTRRWDEILSSDLGR